MAAPLCHFELMTNDTDKCKSFYGAVFDWNFDDTSMPGYTLVKTGAEPTGGIFRKPESAPGVCLNVYFQVANIEDTLQKATALGATILVEKTKIPNVGDFAMLSDPEGIPIGLLQPAGT